jgi:hypothetical protein
MTLRSPRLLLIATLALAALLLGVGSLLTGPTRFGTGEIAHILAGGGDPLSFKPALAWQVTLPCANAPGLPPTKPPKAWAGTK